MTVTKSKKYNIDGKSYFFTFDKDKNLNGISQTAGRNGQYRETPLDPSSAEFATIASSDEALGAYNVNKYKDHQRKTKILLKRYKMVYYLV